MEIDVEYTENHIVYDTQENVYVCYTSITVDGKKKRIILKEMK